MRLKKNYKGRTCKTCNKEISIGSKSGYCVKCTHKQHHRQWTDEDRSRMSKLHIGNKIWSGRKHSEESKKKMSISGKGRGLGRKLSLETRMKLSVAHKGDKNWNWAGGVTPTNRIIRRSIEYRLWRDSVYERDNWTCIWCGDRSRENHRVVLNADHIKPFCDYPELRFALDNGRTLCHDCHAKTSTYKGLSNKNKKYTKRVNRINKCSEGDSQ